MKRRTASLAALGMAIVLAACSGGAATNAPTATATAAATQAPTAAQTAAATTAPTAAASAAAATPDMSAVKDCAKGQTTGPAGEPGTPTDQVSLTADEMAKVKAGNYKAAILWHTSGDFVNGVSRGIKDVFSQLGITIVSEVDAEFDAAKQASQVETVMALNPDIVITLVVDPVSGAQAFKKVVDAGKKLVLISNVPQGFTYGNDYVGIVSDDFFGIGTATADLMGKAVGGSGKIGYIFHDANYYVTNQRDKAFKTVIGQCFPNIQIVAESGLADPAKGEDIASAMLTQHPELNGIYAPWDQPAEGVVAALRSSAKPGVKVVTIDLGANNDLDMAQGGNVFGKAIDLPYVIGTTVATEGAYGVLGKSAPPFAMVPALEVTKANLADAYRQSLHIDPPAQILQVLGQ